MANLNGIGGPWSFDPGSFVEPDTTSTPAGGADASADVSRQPTSGAWTVRAPEATSPQPPRSASMPALRYGSSGEPVRELQTRLNAFRSTLGLKELPVTGNFGRQTQEAVTQFQKMWGLGADGTVGPNTWRRVLGEPNPDPTTPKAGTTAARVLEHRDAILSASEKYGVPPAIIAGIIEMESGGDADVVGETGDKGLLQINPEVHRQFFKDHDWKDPAQSADYGVSLFVEGLRAFSGDVEKALASYNAGVGGVRKGLRNGKALDQITYIPRYVTNIGKFAQKYADAF